jgi:hypothetical protein
VTSRGALAFAGVTSLILSVAAVAIAWRFDKDIALASARVAQAGTVIATRCGPIEYQEAGAGVPLLAVHGSGGGYDQGMAFAGALAQHGIRVIAMSRFGYLRTPMPADSSAASLADSAPPMPKWVENLMMRLIGSDFLFWAALHVARDQVIKLVLATPPELLVSACPQEQARVNAMLHNILPVSARAEGLRSDTAVGKHLGPAPLESIRAPTLSAMAPSPVRSTPRAGLPGRDSSASTRVATPG